MLTGGAELVWTCYFGTEYDGTTWLRRPVDAFVMQ
jgi:hypothetical protein